MRNSLLTGKIIVVTGAARSLGERILTICRAEGATAIATDISGAQNGQVIAHDVTKQADWTRVIVGVLHLHGRIDGPVNNAAIIYPKSSVPGRVSRRVFASPRSGLDGRLAWHANGWPGHAEAGSGSIVNVASRQA